MTVSIVGGNSDIDGNGILPFKINSNLELVVGDAFDLLQLSVADFNVTFAISDVGGKTSNFIGNMRSTGENSTLIPVSLFSGEGMETNNWYSSPWFGSFYTIDNKWLYHEKLDWLYLDPNSGGGFWIWDSYYQNWWWSSQQVFPYAYLPEISNGISGWIYYKMDDSDLKVFEFSNQKWR